MLNQQTVEAMRAPRACFLTRHFKPKAGSEHDLAVLQSAIRIHRLSGAEARAVDFEAVLMRDLMEEVWRDEAHNVVTTVGKADLLDKYFAGSAYTAAWYCGLICGTPYGVGPAVGDTAASHAGWSEAAATYAPNYSAGTRPQLAFSAASGGSKTVSAPAAFTFTSPGTVKGLFTTTLSTKDGTTGILYNSVLFTGGDRIVATNDVVNVSPTYTIT